MNSYTWAYLSFPSCKVLHRLALCGTQCSVEDLSRTMGDSDGWIE